MLANQISQAKTIIQHGGIIAYSTETVLGLGCDPNNEQAVKKILWLKSRAVTNGLIILVDSIESLKKYTKPLSREQHTTITSTKNTTWLIPANSNAPYWIVGEHNNIAIRITNHSTSKPLSCAAHGIVSTSANISSYKILQDQTEIRDWFGPHVDYMIIGESGSNTPSEIRNLLSGEKLR